MKTALITGITGQDGAYLAKFLLDKGYKVYGAFRRISTPNFWRLKAMNLLDKITLISMDLTDQSCMMEIFNRFKFDEVYNLAAQSFVGGSFEHPTCTSEIDAIGVLMLLDTIRVLSPKTRFYQASTSEMYGEVGKNIPQDENTQFHPRSPYASAKVFAHNIVQNYREAYGLFACSGILFNHESPYRGLEFVTRKITNAVARIKLGLQKELVLGNLEAKRDWGHAQDYIEAMWAMLQQDKPEDFVIASGETRTVEEFAKIAFETVGLDYKKYVKTDPNFLRPSEVNLLLGNPTKAKEKLKWVPKTSFNNLVKEMIEADLDRWTNKPLHWDAPNATGWEEAMRHTEVDR
ncbi:TPA: GDP-mannose 4,6-dehydratase [Candidatus Woesearchaeota archaeon]|nr:GDP-mannose 4,6-dehydratase [Candidatus Woesearchaeota archaeon]HIH39500.1 GDP-mannose 4,6-dehydratase [Candidatus Woesearchaeota archaeon]